MNDIKILPLDEARDLTCLLCEGELTADQAVCQAETRNVYAHWTCNLESFPNPYPITHVVGNEEA